MSHVISSSQPREAVDLCFESEKIMKVLRGQQARSQRKAVEIGTQ